MHRLVYFFLTFFMQNQGTLAQQPDWRTNSQRIDNHHAYYNLTQQAINKTLQIFPVNFRCQLFFNHATVNRATGLNIQDSVEVMKACEDDGQYKHLRLFDKKYYVIAKEINLNLTFSSWTDSNNNTYLSEDLFQNIDELQKALFHELMISFDAKSLVYLTTYLKIENKKLCSF